MTRDCVEHAHVREGASHRFELELPVGLAAFDGHFAEDPVLPAAVLLDWAFERVARAWPGVGEIDRVRGLKLYRGLVPGDRLTLLLVRRGAREIDLEVAHGGERAAIATLVIAGDALRFCALVPTYDNPRTVRDVVEAIRAHIPDVIVVDDGSGAEGRAVCDALGREGLALVLTRAQNGGKGAAVMDGLRRAAELGFTHALQIDADGQHDPRDVPLLLDAARARPDALVTGAPVFDAGAPRARVWGRELTRFWGRVETGGRVDVDALCGYRVYPIRAALASGTKGEHMDFDPEILVRLVWGGAPVVPVPTRVRYFRREDGGVSHFRMLRDNALISWMHTRLCVTAILRAAGVAP